jgi:hypothetical protein
MERKKQQQKREDEIKRRRALKAEVFNPCQCINSSQLHGLVLQRNFLGKKRRRAYQVNNPM